ncbi:hypothetical protein QN277_026557 [Acacia crassicarpa]|uniref:Uncharacterized protein n=1 Tax=Acacia crassicarpa TaxID=499986 RepID=A0AAE1MM21_9FABA|nr:hypothetical protein QN277_026557 [Acacia crassicarpa]
MTFSGVGKCRQVGICDSGIDDAVQKLVARGYKVGIVEQLETFEEAKAKGANSVSDLNNGSVEYGFAFVDCVALKLWVGSIDDYASCSTLGTLLLQVSPKEVIYERRGLSKEAQKALKKYSLNGSVLKLL